MNGWQVSGTAFRPMNVGYVSVCGLDAQTHANDRFRHELTFKMPDGCDRLWSRAATSNDGNGRQEPLT